jgi:hypothetical protein
MTLLGWLFHGVRTVLTSFTVWCFVKIWQAPFQPKRATPGALESPPHESGAAEWHSRERPSALHPSS